MFLLKKRLSLVLILCLLITVAFTPSAVQAEQGVQVIETATYPIQNLSVYEMNATFLLPVGTVIVMYPDSMNVTTGPGAESMVICNQVRTVVMAGIGTTSQGTAAFAKHVAQATGQPVAGIVTGYGDWTAYNEYIQGHYVGRAANTNGTYYYEVASEKLAYLYNLGARPLKLIGHSKGNLDLANTLYKLWWEGKMYMYQGVRVITFGCGVKVPVGVGIFQQYMGTADYIGMDNTTSYFNLLWLAGKEHTINPAYVNYLPTENYVN